MEQLEFADVIILNKVRVFVCTCVFYVHRMASDLYSHQQELVSEEQLNQIEAFVQQLNPRAHVLRASYGDVSVEHVLGTQRFSYETALASPGDRRLNSCILLDPHCFSVFCTS